MLKAINPATGETIREYAPHDGGEVEKRLQSAWNAWERWREIPIAERAPLVRRASDVLAANRAKYGRLMTEEMGKPITQSLAEIDKCAWAARHYAEQAEEYLTPDVIPTDAHRSYVRFDPLGPLLAVMPWNFPFWQVFRAACPALMAGDTVLLKHSSNVPGCALAIEEIFREAGLPQGAFTTLLVGSADMDRIIDDPRVRAVTLTGSDGAGEKVAGRAGMRLKKTVLELGGSDPFVVLADADVEVAARTAAAARLINSGQSCIAAKRFIVHRAVAGTFTDTMLAHMRDADVGDPLDESTEVGPLAREDLRAALHDQVQRTVGAGGRLLLGGEPLDRPGYYYPPTMLDRITPEMPAGYEETFGPVAAILVVETEDDAVRVANTTRFGLGASVWSRDAERAERLARRIEAGAVFVNGLVKSDPRLPFGGIKSSGYGRELGREGIREFVNQKTVVVS